MFYTVTWCVSRDAPCCACVELATTEKWTAKAQLQGRWVTVCLTVDTTRLCRGGNVSDAGIAADVSTLTPARRNDERRRRRRRHQRDVTSGGSSGSRGRRAADAQPDGTRTVSSGRSGCCGHEC
ncbi:hypothetical protein NP493_675g01012 [Ridgeia piscesae]|uniref:Uncharacterized protein n=1 Tax=Ridgeia piscesae TaxID=27915 RepID=A0AAD9KRK4_RIDPI|nr:hypothetical protein NP493_675g01012 [Ridgeia piscesae]